MTTDDVSDVKIRYFPKELSWLSFNERVLQEAKDPSNPVIERMRFLGIYSNNMDEFFQVRVADVKGGRLNTVIGGCLSPPDKLSLNPALLCFHSK